MVNVYLVLLIGKPYAIDILIIILNIIQSLCSVPSSVVNVLMMLSVHGSPLDSRFTRITYNKARIGQGWYSYVSYRLLPAAIIELVSTGTSLQAHCSRSNYNSPLHIPFSWLVNFNYFLNISSPNFKQQSQLNAKTAKITLTQRAPVEPYLLIPNSTTPTFPFYSSRPTT